MSDSKDISTAVDNIDKELSKVLQHRKDDYDYSRDVLYMAAESLMDILESAKVLAQESEHPRAIEVATNTANSLADVAAKMMDHQLRTEKLNNTNAQTSKEVHNTTNNLNVNLKTSDLLEMLTRDQ